MQHFHLTKLEEPTSS